MLRVVVALASIAGAMAFSAPTVPSLRSGATSVSMSMDRRSAAAAIGAGIIAIPQISEAKSGDFPKQAYFGDQPISAPFGDTYGTTGAGLWEAMGDTERGIFERIAKKTNEQLLGASNLIKDSAWEASRQQLRLIMGETRKSMTRLTLADGSGASQKNFDKFKKEVERLDLALRAKDQDKAISGIGNVRSTYNDWCTSVGLQ